MSNLSVGYEGSGYGLSRDNLEGIGNNIAGVNKEEELEKKEEEITSNKKKRKKI